MAFDAPHQQLIRDLEAQPVSPARAQLLSKAYACDYHCVVSPTSSSPKTDLVAALLNAGFVDMAHRARIGVYDNEPPASSAREPSLRGRGNGRPFGYKLVTLFLV